MKQPSECPAEFRDGLLRDIEWAERGVEESEEELSEARAILAALQDRLRQHDRARQE